MAVTNYYSMNRANMGSTTPGYSQRAWIAPRSWFATVQEPAPGVGGAISKRITLDHSFETTPTNAGFIQLYALPKSVEVNGTTSGDPGALNMTYTPKLFLAGDSPELQVMIEQLLNDDCILLLEDLKCPGGDVFQFGCDCAPVNITKVDFTSGTRGNGNKGWAIEAESICRFVYEGTVDEMA